MTPIDYIQQPLVQQFIDWLIKATAHNGFHHSYTMNRPKGQLWSCSSLWDAYNNYNWSFTCTLPNQQKVKGKTYTDNEQVLNTLSIGIRQALQDGDDALLRSYCIAILDWGGVINGNKKRIDNLTDSVAYFTHACEQLKPNKTSLNKDFTNVHMNAGFTKIYALLLDDFIIYDGRVGASLGLLVRQFLEANKFSNVPSELCFAFGNPKISNYQSPEIKKRNPSTDIYRFPLLSNNTLLHINNNIRANWLLREVAQKSLFNQCSQPLRALEAALFMIGYDIRQKSIA